MNKLLVVFAFTLLVSGEVQAEIVTIYGFGVASCGDWIEDRKSGEYHAATQWVLGTMSAIGRYTNRVLTKTNVNAITAWMDNYCQKNPLVEFHDGVHELVVVLTKNK